MTVFRIMALLVFAMALGAAPWQAAGQSPESVKLTLRSAPAGAAVSVDGTEVCRTPCEAQVFVGTHVVGMEHDGYLAREEMIEVKAALTVSWHLSPDNGTLTVTSEPDGIDVRIECKGAGVSRREKTPVVRMSVAPGECVVTVVSPLYEKQERNATVPAGDSASVTLEPRPSAAVLGVSVVDQAGEPDTAVVTLDGKVLKGSGPWTVKPGRHRLVVKKDRSVLLDQEVDVDAGEELDLSVSTGAPLSP
jgi:hypothetical protein